MIYEQSFQFDELSLNLSEVNKVLGYKGQELPEPFQTYLKQAMDDCKNLNGIRGSCYLTEQCSIERSAKIIEANNVEFKVGKTICQELTGSSRLVFFICTAGEEITKKSEIQLNGEDPVLGYVFDVLGSLIAEAVADKIQKTIQDKARKKGEQITNRYSPGYCNWPVSDQPKLFSLFNKTTSGVSLTSSFLMIPVKSVSGVFGIGKEVKYREYHCTLCNQANCIYGNSKK